MRVIEVIILKWSLNWLIKQKNGQFDFEESLTFPKEMFYNLSQINGLKDSVRVSGHGHFFEADQRLYVTLHVEGTMIVPCAISSEPVEYPFELDETEIFAFYKPDEDEDVIEAKKDTADLTPVVFQEIMMVVPMRVVKEGAELTRTGKGWQVLDESDVHTNEEDNPIDPRLAKLKDYFKNKE
jgi:uncharacterized protein